MNTDLTEVFLEMVEFIDEIHYLHLQIELYGFLWLVILTFIVIWCCVKVSKK
jgi:hypothetical protein